MENQRIKDNLKNIPTTVEFLKQEKKKVPEEEL